MTPMPFFFLGGDHDGEIITVDTHKGEPPPEYRLQSRTMYRPWDGATEVPYSVQSYARTEWKDKDGSRMYIFVNGDPTRPLRQMINQYAALKNQVKTLEDAIRRMANGER